MTYIQTFSGKKFDVVDCTLDDIQIIDIAHGLSNICRFGGQIPQFYSVAQHSVLMADEASTGLRLSALLHDASEAYMGDMCRHLKDILGEHYVAVEHKLMEKIAEKFQFTWPMPPELKWLDRDMVETEFALLWDDKRFEGRPVYGHVLPIRIKPWSPDYAKFVFLDWFQELAV